MDRELDQDTTVFQWDVYAGAALTSPGVEPIHLILTADIVTALHGGDSDYWAALIGVIEDDLAEDLP